MLVPELDQAALGVKTEPVDGTKLLSLLNQVLEANKTTTASSSAPPTDTASSSGAPARNGVQPTISDIKSEILNPAASYNKWFYNIDDFDSLIYFQFRLRSNFYTHR